MRYRPGTKGVGLSESRFFRAGMNPLGLLHNLKSVFDSDL